MGMLLLVVLFLRRATNTAQTNGNMEQGDEAAAYATYAAYWESLSPQSSQRNIE